MFKNCPVCGNPIGKIPPVEGCTSYFLCGINENTADINDCTGIPLQLYGCANCGMVFLHSDKLMNSSLVRE